MAENTKLTARVPIICSDYENKNIHKDKELVMDYKNTDLYLRDEDRYVNITGKLKDQIQEIQDGSMVVHIVTEDTLPPIKDRPENHWYYVITKSKDLEGKDINTTTYVYYGVVNQDFFNAKNYILIAQNMIKDPGTVHLTVQDGYRACFYVPTQYNPSFYTNGEVIPFDLVDRLYIMSNELNSIIAVDVYVSQEEALGDIDITIDYQGNMYYQVILEPNEPSIIGLEMPESPINVKAGSPIGKIADPKWMEMKYRFRGWSLNKIQFTSVNTETYIPEKNMKLYAFFEYDASSRMPYRVKSVSSSNSAMPVMFRSALAVKENVLSLYTDSENIDAYIYPKQIEGYNTPDPVILKEENQDIEFVYSPIEYNITYDLGNYAHITDARSTYTVEDYYTPPDPERKNHRFVKWEPECIKPGMIGDITFTAIWKECGVTLNGKLLNRVLDDIESTRKDITLLNDLTNRKTDGALSKITAIQRVDELPDSDFIVPTNISINATPILAWYIPDTHAVYVYCEEDIVCNTDMVGAFANMPMLRTIKGLESWKTQFGTDISKIFYNDTVLSDIAPIYSWGSKFSNFDNAFTGTAAASISRLPEWYRWAIKVLSYSTTTKLLATGEYEVIPGESILAPNRTGYLYPEISEIVPESNNNTYQFTYSPIEYNINYDLGGGELFAAKTSYTIEDEDYYPPEPIKDGYTFAGWYPDHIVSGSVGDITMIASWK